jgi:hypothetical protein
MRDIAMSTRRQSRGFLTYLLPASLMALLALYSRRTPRAVIALPLATVGYVSFLWFERRPRKPAKPHPLDGRGIHSLDPVPVAHADMRRALAHADGLVGSIEPVIGRKKAVELSNAIAGVCAAYEGEFMSRLITQASAIINDAGDVFVLERDGEEAEA